MQTNPLKSQAAALISKLEGERGGRTIMLYQVVKTQKTTPVVLNAAAELQATFVAEVVEIYVKMGTPKGKLKEWFRDNAVPNASAEIVRLLLRRQLPFTDHALAEMFEKLSGISFLALVAFREQLAQALEKHAKKNTISPRLRKAVARYANVLAVRHVSQKQAKFWKEEWGFPGTIDRKTAARIDKLLAR